MEPATLGFTKWPSVAGSFSGRVVVCGSGRSLWDDLKAVPWAQPYDYCGVKQAGVHIPFKMRHWAGCHGERFQFYLPLRKDEFGNDGYYFRGKANGVREVHAQKLGSMIHAEAPYPMVDHVWEAPLTGTSSLFATKIMLALGYDEVLLAGCPLDDSGRYYDAPWNKGCDLNPMSLKEWEEFLPIFNGRVKSMSGRTRELLGGL